MSEFRKGDRVRITLEAELGAVYDDGNHLETRHNYFDLTALNENGDSVTVEKLAPVWVNGDVIKHTGAGVEYHRIDDKWISTNGHELGDNPSDWRPDHLKVIRKVER